MLALVTACRQPMQPRCGSQSPLRITHRVHRTAPDDAESWGLMDAGALDNVLARAGQGKQGGGRAR